MAFQIELGSHFHLWGPGCQLTGDTGKVLIFADIGAGDGERFIMPRGIRFHFHAGKTGVISGRGLAEAFDGTAVESKERDKDGKTILMTDYRIVTSGGRAVECAGDIKRFADRTGYCVVTVRHRQGVLEDSWWQFRRLSYLLWLLRRSYGDRFTDFHFPSRQSNLDKGGDTDSSAEPPHAMEDAA